MSSSMVQAQCDDLEPEDSKYGYQQREGRCEGFYKSNVSGFAIEIVSLTQGDILYALNSNEKLKIELEPLDGFNSISVRGVNISMEKNYRLDLDLDRGEVAAIPVKDVLEPNDVEPSNLGLFGFIEKSGYKYFVPVIPSSELGSKLTQKRSIKLSISSNIDLQTFTWRYAIAKGELCGEYSELITLPSTFFDRNSPIPLEIPEMLTKGTFETSICIQISVLGTNGIEFSENFRLMIPKTDI